MSSASRAASVAARLASVEQSLAEIAVDVDAIRRGVVEVPAGSSVGEWLKALHDAVGQMRVECADARYVARELTSALPPVDTVQPRLL